MNKITFSLLLCLVINLAIAQSGYINPPPQEFIVKDWKAIPSNFNVRTIEVDAASRNLLSTYFNKENTSEEGFPILVSMVNDKFPKSYLNKVPENAEGYFIKSTGERITIIGRDPAGTYYGIRTLLHLLDDSRFPIGEISDYPDITSRGVVEGFYGTPWTFENRLRQIDFYGIHKLNTYIYGPKDDPYHSSPNWRKPYPQDEADQLKKLIRQADLNHVDFVWAIHPGKDIQWNKEDRKALLQKFEWMYKLGVRSFAVFFDDISGKGTDPSQQAELLNYLNDQFIEKKKDVNPLIMCPTEYNKSWSNPKGNYLETLGSKLDPSIQVMWTGNSVVSDIDQATINWINTKIKRKAFIWWNFPVSDYVRDHLLLGPAYGNSKEIANNLAGFVSNPMEHAESSKIAIHGVAGYTWNMNEYDPKSNWRNALKNLMPESFEALKFFASHNSDLGKNGHGYRRNESENFAGEAEIFLKDLRSNRKIRNLEKVKNEFKLMVESAQVLLNSKDNPILIHEIRPWVIQFRLLGEAGLSMIRMNKALKTGNPEEFERNYNEIKSIKAQMYQIDTNENQNPYQPGVKTASLVITPLIQDSFRYLTETYNINFKKNLETESEYNPHTLITTISQLNQQRITLKNKVVTLNPPLEIIRFQPGDFVGIELESPTLLEKIEYKLDPAKSRQKLKLEISLDGQEWTMPPTRNSKNRIVVFLENRVKSIRISNISSENIETKIENFKIEIK